VFSSGVIGVDRFISTATHLCPSGTGSTDEVVGMLIRIWYA